MAKLLYRLAAYCAAHRRQVVSFWVVLFIGLGAIMMVRGADISDGDFVIPGSDSALAQDVIQQAFPSPDGLNDNGLDLVFHAHEGTVNDPAASASIAEAIAAASQVDYVVSVSNPLEPGSDQVSPDGTVAIASITFADLGDDESRQEAAEHAINEIAGRVASDQFDVIVGGELVDDAPELLGPTEIAGVIVAFVVLLITFGSLVTAGANMLSALFGVAFGVIGIMAYSTVDTIESSTPILAVMLGLAVGIDYSLFIISRFRDELKKGLSVEEAIPMAVGTAGSAVIFAGATVIIALAGLAVVGISFITEMGFAAALTVAAAVLISLTLLPVLMRLIGLRTLPKKQRATATGESGPQDRAHDEDPGRLSIFERWAGAITAHPVRSLVVSIAALLVFTIPYVSMETALNVPGGNDPESQTRQAYNLVAEKFGEGFQSPLIVLVQAEDAATASASISVELAGFPNVAGVSVPQPSADNSAAILSVTPTEGPNADSTFDLVHSIREAEYGAGGASVSVTGQTAVDIDVDEALSAALIVYIALIVALAILLLIVLFRSILVPVIAAIGFLLSLGAGLGVMVALFQWGWFGQLTGVKEGQPILSLLPIVIVGILFGLAMDYQVFLVSRIHEAHVRGYSPAEAIRFGFGRAASVVAAAAIIMASVFFGFGLSGSTLVASIAVALASGVLFDAFIVRMVIVPAALKLLDEKAWWIPAWLDRVIPHIDTEGQTLEEYTSDAGARG